MTLIDKSEMFLSILEVHKGIVYKIANSYCNNPEDRKDIAQEIVLQLWKSFDNYNNQYKHSTWIYRIALNVAISFYRKETTRKKVLHPYGEDIFNFADLPVNVEAEVHIRFLQQLISELKELDKALMLLYLEEIGHKEMSEIVGISETNVATKIGRIKTIFKQKFSQIEK